MNAGMVSSCSDTDIATQLQVGTKRLRMWKPDEDRGQLLHHAADCQLDGLYRQNVSDFPRFMRLDTYILARMQL